MRVQQINTNFNLGHKRPVNQKHPNFGRNWSEHISWGANYVKETGKTNFKLFSFPDAKAVFVEVANKVASELGYIKERAVSIITVGTGAIISTIDNDSKLYRMEDKGNGIFEANKVDAKPNDSYRFVVVTKDNDINLVKDPYAKVQDEILGWSSIYDKDNYQWKNTDWLSGKDSRRITRKPNESLRGLEYLIIEEVNVPTLSKEGTFEQAKARIDKIAENNFATAVEIMPVENTFSKQWGYDGVDKFAPNSKLGGAEKLKELIDYIHGKGLNVIIDMVSNHMGPWGDYLSETGPYINRAGDFGNLFNYEGYYNKSVRDFMVNAMLAYANDFKVDGIRCDLTDHSHMQSHYILREMAAELNEHNPDVFLIAEDHSKKRHVITSYINEPNKTHEEIINEIDEALPEGGYRSSSEDKPLGFDSEWDSDYKDALRNSLYNPNAQSLNDLEWQLTSSDYRVKYAFSHDEIGNEDGTRFIPKYITRHFDLAGAVNAFSAAERGQKGAQAAQKLSELIVSKDFENLSEDEIRKIEYEEIGLKRYIPKEELINTFKTAIAKQKLMFGTLMTTPGPKMFFQGDSDADLSHFKFFRETPDSENERADLAQHISVKGYDQLEKIARPDCIVGRVKYDGLFKDIPKQMVKYNQDLAALIRKYPALAKGTISHNNKIDFWHNVHAHKLTLDGEEFLILKHYGNGFLVNNYNYDGFPEKGTWKEIFNSDSKEYGGSGYVNGDRNDITSYNQNISLAPNSIVILKKES